MVSVLSSLPGDRATIAGCYAISPPLKSEHHLTTAKVSGRASISTGNKTDSVRLSTVNAL